MVGLLMYAFNILSRQSIFSHKKGHCSRIQNIKNSKNCLVKQMHVLKEAMGVFSITTHFSFDRINMHNYKFSH